MAYVISEGCLDVKDKSSLDNCPVGCRHEGRRMVCVHADECIESSFCEPLCPQEPIYYEPDLLAGPARHVGVNAEFFAEVGSPGNATGVDYADRDHSLVAALPPRPGERLLTILSTVTTVAGR